MGLETKQLGKTHNILYLSAKLSALVTLLLTQYGYGCCAYYNDGGLYSVRPHDSRETTSDGIHSCQHQKYEGTDVYIPA